MKPRQLSHCLLGALAALATVAAGTARAQTHEFTLDDYLALEATGDGAAHGERIVWEQAPPYDQIGYYGHNPVGAWGNSGFTLRTVVLATPEVSATPLFQPEPGVSYWFDSFSPDGRYAAFLAAREGTYFVGAYDTRTKRIETFAQAPSVDWWNQELKSVWVSGEELVFSAYEGDRQPLDAARPYTGHRLAAAWEKAWQGEVSVSIDTTGLEQQSVPAWKSGRLYRANARTGAVNLLAEGMFESLKVSADGRYLAGLRQADRPQPDPSKPNVDWVWSLSQLTLFDLRADGALKVIAPEKLVSIETVAWAPDANRLVFFAWDEGEGVQSGVFHSYDVATGTVTPYPHNGLDLVSIAERGLGQRPERVMWVDGRLAIFARRHDGEAPRFTYGERPGVGLPDAPGKADWFLIDAQGEAENLTSQFGEISPVPLDADAETLTILADGDAWRVGPGREPENLTASIGPKLVLPSSMRNSKLHWPFRGETILVSEDAERPGFALIDLESDRAVFLASPAPDAEFLGGSVQSGAVLFRHDHDDGADLILEYADGRRVVLDRLNEHMAEVAKTRWTTIRYEVDSHVGVRELESCVLLPPDYEVGRRYPVIVEIYPLRAGGCLNPAAQKYDAIGRRPGSYSLHLLAARGYVVLKPNTSGEVTQTEDGPMGGMADIVEQGVDALVEQGYGDPNRVGLIGFSWGGFSSLWLATQSDIFKAVVSLHGFADMYTDYFGAGFLQKFYSHEVDFGFTAGRYESTVSTAVPIGKKPFEDPMAYIRPSPLFNAPGVTAPIMLIHSDMDGSLEQYERMYAALLLQGKKAKLMRYWGEGHGPSSPGNIRHMWNAIFDWFDTYLSSPPTEDSQ